MAASTYGAYQPGAVDPWNIESVLAKEAITSPADAQGMLSSYAQQRQAQGYVYGQQADQQHEFAKQQLTAQMQEARNKLIPELVGKPGGGAFLAGGGIQGVGPGDGGNAAAWAGLGQAGQQHDFATNIGDIGKGVESLSRAGQDLPIQQIPGLQTYQTHGAGEHSDISVERIKAATALQTAAMHAKGRGAGGSTGGFTVPLPVTPETGNLPFTARSGKGESFEQFRDRVKGYTPSTQPVTPAGDQSTAQTDPGGARGRDNARGATRNVAPASRVANAAPGADAVQRQYQTYVETKLRTQNPTAYADIMERAKRNGNVVQLGRDAKGVFIQGERGTYQ